MARDGSRVKRLTDNPAFDAFPNWSGDGRIVFTSNRSGNLDIFVMNADGSALKRLTHDQGNDRTPAWSPDGKKIAFESDRDGESHIYVMNDDGSDQHRLTHTGSPEFNPAWLPDRADLRLSFDLSGQGIWTSGLNGSDLTKVANGSTATWSNDGSLTFQIGQGIYSRSPGDSAQIVVVRRDQEELTLTDGKHPDEVPALTNDGAFIAFRRSVARSFLG